jgi:hypothetical protein
MDNDQMDSDYQYALELQRQEYGQNMINLRTGFEEDDEDILPPLEPAREIRIPILYQGTPLENFLRIIDTRVYELLNEIPLQEQENVIMGISKESLKKLKVDCYKNVKNNCKQHTCVICMDDFIDNDIIRETPCEHLFHRLCIDRWLLKESYKCPTCRKECGKGVPINK